MSAREAPNRLVYTEITDSGGGYCADYSQTFTGPALVAVVAALTIIATLLFGAMTLTYRALLGFTARPATVRAPNA